MWLFFLIRVSLFIPQKLETKTKTKIILHKLCYSVGKFELTLYRIWFKLDQHLFFLVCFWIKEYATLLFENWHENGTCIHFNLSNNNKNNKKKEIRMSIIWAFIFKKLYSIFTKNPFSFLIRVFYFGIFYGFPHFCMIKMWLNWNTYKYIKVITYNTAPLLLFHENLLNYSIHRFGSSMQIDLTVCDCVVCTVYVKWIHFKFYLKRLECFKRQ